MRVLAWNEKTGQLTFSLVQQTFVRTANEIYRVKYDDGSVIETTWSHPFYITGKGWVKGKDLRPGMKSPTAKAIAEHNERMAMSGGYRLPVKMVSFTNDNTGKQEASVLLAEDLPGAMTIKTVEVLPGQETVYNFSVEDAHSYFVGEDGVLVHNEPYALNFNRSSSILTVAEIKKANSSDTLTFRGQTYKREKGKDGNTFFVGKDPETGEATMVKITDYGTIVVANPNQPGYIQEYDANGQRIAVSRLNAGQTMLDKSGNPVKDTNGNLQIAGPGARLPSLTPITSPFDPDRVFIGKDGKKYYGHRGVDQASTGGGDYMGQNATVAVSPGVVKSVGNAGDAGLMVVIDHGDGVLTKYMHNTSVVVKPGQAIMAGQVVAISGSSGIGSGAHIHFQIDVVDRNGAPRPVDPLKFNWDAHEQKQAVKNIPSYRIGTNTGICGRNMSCLPKQPACGSTMSCVP
jgi:murein DD-endopeptidase MepM/ murein hydrolase activator NlpD